MSTSIKIDRSNNFDFLRLLFASLVIISHSYPLTRQLEIIAKITNEQLSLGSLSVDCFFIMSGYLIMTSLQRSESPQEYIWKRLLRLYPALLVLLMVTMLFLPFVYQGKDIFSENSYQTYFQNALSLYNVQYNVAGVFEHNPYPKAINGSLWSLSYEFTMYITLLFLFPLRKSKNLLTIIAIFFFFSFYCMISQNFLLEMSLKKILILPDLFYKLAAYFLGGSILALCNLKKHNTLAIRLVLAGLLILSLYLHIYKYISPIALPILIIFIGINKNKYISQVGKKIGDISYGVYIYGFIVQQTLMYFLGLGTVKLMIVSMLITYIFAYFSWHFIEKPTLKYKDLVK